MVLKRKLPTQEAKVETKEVDVVEDNFDMSIETDVKPTSKVDKGLDLNDDFPDKVEDRPEDFIPAELRALESENSDIKQEEKSFDNIEPAAAVLDNEELKNELENEDISPVAFDEPEDSFNMSLDDESTTQAEEAVEIKTNIFDETQDEVKDEITFQEQSFEDNAPVFEAPEFENQEHANWQEVVESKHDSYKDDSFETISWDDSQSATEELAPSMEEDKFEDAKDDFNEEIFGGNNGGIIPELPGMSFDTNDNKPAEFMGQNSQDLSLNGDAKRKLMIGFIGTALVVGGIFVYSNMDTTTEVANRWTGALTEANQDIPETKEEEAALLEDGVDITKTETVVDFSELSSDDKNNKEEHAAISELDDEGNDSATEIDLLEPEVIEKTSSGKEVIKATGAEEMPKEVEEGANLITNITEAYAKQKAADKGIDLEKEISEEQQKETLVENAADMNKKVDEQLAEYRKLLAAEEDPGKKVKPGAFFKGNTSNKESASANVIKTPASVNVARVNLDSSDVNAIPADYIATSQQVEGHQVVEYPKGVARKQDEGIRQLDHFRSLMVEKEDQRVRMPKGVKPGLRNQGFPQFKVISIVPNYGLIGEYEGKKGILMIGDSFQGWELVGVYESYAEFKKDTRKHIISLR